MKRLCLILLCLTLPNLTKEEKIPVNYSMPVPREFTKTKFLIALENVLSYEGYYVNHPKDRGYETYCGISRRYSPDWMGWYNIDQYKIDSCGKSQKIKWNTHFPELDHWVLDYYLTIWVKEGFQDIRDPGLASYLFELRINGPISTFMICNALRDYGYNFYSITITPEMVATINEIDRQQFLYDLRKHRVLFYKKIVRKDPSQKIFLQHWLKRANTLPS